MKYCTKCETEKDMSKFNVDNNRRDGKMIYCKKCMKEINKTIRKRNNNQRTDYNKKYRNKNRGKYNEWERDYYSKNKEKLDRKSKDWRHTIAGTFTVMHLSAKDRARRKNIPYELSPDIIRMICETQHLKCDLTDIVFDFSSDKRFKSRPFAPSLDRIDTKKGYTLDNIQMVCVIVNRAKNEYSQELFDKICEARVRVLNG